MYTLILEAVYVVILIFVFIGVQFVSVSVAVCAELTSIVQCDMWQKLKKLLILANCGYLINVEGPTSDVFVLFCCFSPGCHKMCIELLSKVTALVIGNLHVFFLWSLL